MTRRTPSQSRELRRQVKERYPHEKPKELAGGLGITVNHLQHIAWQEGVRKAPALGTGVLYNTKPTEAVPTHRLPGHNKVAELAARAANGQELFADGDYVPNLE
jgi:hypothetical protein